MRWEGKTGMTASIVTVTVILTGVLFLFASQGPWAAALKMVAERHKEIGLECGTCHKENPPREKVSAVTCIGCHGDAETMAKRAKSQNLNYHDGKELNCILCHTAHK